MAGNDIKPESAGKKPSLKVFGCPTCGSNVNIRAVGETIIAVCGSCASTIDTSDENYKVLSKGKLLKKKEPLIPLGARGKLHGVLWEAIGYLERRDGTGVYSWCEYLLFNPIKGFRWLMEFDGHWNYIVTTKEKPQTVAGGTQKSAKYLGKSYALFHRGSAKITHVVGEFYWRAAVGDTVNVEDYISPPEILSREQDGHELIWSLGQYVTADEVKKAFPMISSMPLQTGVAPNQPSTISYAAGSVGKYTTWLLVVLLATQFAFILTAKNETVYSGHFPIRASDTEKVKTTPQFELKHGTANVEIVMTASVQNNWLELQTDLVNDETGETFEFEQGVEFYSGSDSDGRWSEGSWTSEKLLSSIPAGKYHLNFEPSSGANTAWSSDGKTDITNDLNFDIVVKRDVGTWTNFLCALVLMMIYPLLVWWRSRSFEMSRWSQSDFSPYYSQDDD